MDTTETPSEETFLADWHRGLDCEASTLEVGIGPKMNIFDTDFSSGRLHAASEHRVCLMRKDSSGNIFFNLSVVDRLIL